MATLTRVSITPFEFSPGARHAFNPTRLKQACRALKLVPVPVCAKQPDLIDLQDEGITIWKPDTSSAANECASAPTTTSPPSVGVPAPDHAEPHNSFNTKIYLSSYGIGAIVQRTTEDVNTTTPAEVAKAIAQRRDYHYHVRNPQVVRKSPNITRSGRANARNFTSRSETQTSSDVGSIIQTFQIHFADRGCSWKRYLYKQWHMSLPTPAYVYSYFHCAGGESDVVSTPKDFLAALLHPGRYIPLQLAHVPSLMNHVAEVRCRVEAAPALPKPRHLNGEMPPETHYDEEDCDDTDGFVSIMDETTSLWVSWSGALMSTSTPTPSDLNSPSQVDVLENTNASSEIRPMLPVDRTVQHLLELLAVRTQIGWYGAYLVESYVQQRNRLTHSFLPRLRILRRQYLPAAREAASLTSPGVTDKVWDIHRALLKSGGLDSLTRDSSNALNEEEVQRRDGIRNTVTTILGALGVYLALLGASGTEVLRWSMFPWPTIALILLLCLGGLLLFSRSFEFRYVRLVARLWSWYFGQEDDCQEFAERDGELHKDDKCHDQIIEDC